MNRLNLYTLDMKYVRDLARADDNVMSVSPQVQKQGRPFVGVVVVCAQRSYCIPLSSPKPKHEHMRNSLDFSRILDKRGRLIGVLNLNNMIPVDASVIRRIDLTQRLGDSAETRRYKALMNDQLDWCNENRNVIARKANKLYALITQNPERSRALVKRCCNFKKLEALLDARCMG